MTVVFAAKAVALKVPSTLPRPVGQRQVVDVGAAGALRPGSIVNARRMRYGQMNKNETDALIANQCLGLRA